MLHHYTMDWLKQSVDAGVTHKFLYFWGHTSKQNDAVGKNCFSQWFESPFTVDGTTYKTAEHWMMAHKAALFSDNDIFEEIIQADKPGEVKALGRKVKGYNDDTWNARKFDIVKDGNFHKFSQHTDLKAFLLQTGDRVIVEASPVDAIWGIGLAQDSKGIDDVHSWRGENLLGFALMEVRDALRQ